MEVLVKNQALEHLFSACADEFYTQCPGLSRVAEQHVADQSNLLRKANGMSREGTMMHVASIPSFMFAFIKQQAAKRLAIDDVWKDKDNLQLFIRTWRTAAIKRQTRPRQWIKPNTSPSPP